MIRRIKELSRANLTLDPGLQQREDGLDSAVVSEYAENIESLPPVVVFTDGKTHWLADGFHTYKAHDEAGLETIRCDLRDGDWLDAFKFSLGANRSHGLRRTNADKRKAVLRAFEVAAERKLKWSASEIARMVGVAVQTVINVKKDCQGPSNLDGQAGSGSGGTASSGSSGSSGRREEAKDPIEQALDEGEENRREMLDECKDDADELASQVQSLREVLVDELAAVAKTLMSLGMPRDEVLAYVGALRERAESLEAA